MLGRYRKHWSATEHRTEVSPIGYQARTHISIAYSALHVLSPVCLSDGCMRIIV